MVNQAGNWGDAEPLHLTEGFGKDLEAAPLAEALPVQAVAKGADAQCGNGVEISRATIVT